MRKEFVWIRAIIMSCVLYQHTDVCIRLVSQFKITNNLSDQHENVVILRYLLTEKSNELLNLYQP